MARISKHEEVCAERYNGIAAGLRHMANIDEERHSGINARLKRMEGMILGAIGTSLGAMGAIILRAGHLL